MPRLPTPLMIALGLLATGAVAVIIVLARFWGANPEYADRFLIVLGAGWVAWQRRAELASLPLRPTPAGWVLLAAGAVVFPIGWFLQAQVSPKAILLWWLTYSWFLAASGLVLVLGGTAHLRRLAFPLIFLLFALPIPDRFLYPLQLKLQGITTTAAGAVLPVLGIPVQRDGFVLRLPSGDLGVAEACSGVRSVTALTALAAFVACLKGFGPVRGLVLLILSVPVIAAVNAFRVVLSGLIQEWFDSKYIQGTWHEMLGILMIFLGLGFILGLAGLLDRRKKPEPAVRTASPPSETPVRNWGRTPAFAAVLLGLSAIGCLAAQFLGQGAEHGVVANAPLDQIPLTIGNWKGTEQPVQEFITEMLTYDTVMSRTYRNDLGDEVYAWVIFWSSQGMVKGYHHPDICVASRGFDVRERAIQPVSVTGGGSVPVTVREFVQQRNKNERLLVLYWTQEGRRVWSEKDEEAAQLTGDSHRWMSERLFGTANAAEDGRFVILISTPMSGDGTRMRRETLDFARQLADAVYELCPWARPLPEGKK